MRFLALQTDVEVLKKQYIPAGESEIMTVRRHVIIFILDYIWKTTVAITVAIILLIGFRSVGISVELLLLANVLFLILILWYVYQMIKSFIAWRYNFLIVTSDKIIIINHHSFFHHKMSSIHLDTITSSKFESQFFGLIRCGRLHIHLNEQEGQGSTIVVTIAGIPAPDTVASAIEHAIVLKQQRAKGTESLVEQAQKAGVIKETLEVEAKVAPVSAPLPEVSNETSNVPPSV